eukprot:GHVN01083070.1.p2 GENE.GHVN01083070.1~~GHVN01083070.1.p2  ORF type:complete len:328 (-),score=55.77 GHVN01083070.1:161-1144(-)
MGGNDLAQAMSLFFDFECGTVTTPSKRPGRASSPPLPANPAATPPPFTEVQEADEEYVPAPLPSVTERLFRGGNMDRSPQDATPVNNTMVTYSDLADAGELAFKKQFQPPTDIICSLSLEEAQLAAKESNKFVLVNIQKPDEFATHNLNRDVWSNEMVQEVVRFNFFFWQRNNGSGEAAKFVKLYRIESLPFVGVLCSVTGRLLKTWEAKKMADDPNEFVAKLVDFVESGGKPPPIATPQPPAPTGATKKGQAALTGEESNGSQALPCPANQAPAKALNPAQGSNSLGRVLGEGSPSKAPPPANSMNAFLAELHEARLHQQAKKAAE